MLLLLLPFVLEVSLLPVLVGLGFLAVTGTDFAFFFDLRFVAGCLLPVAALVGLSDWLGGAANICTLWCALQSSSRNPPGALCPASAGVNYSYDVVHVYSQRVVRGSIIAFPVNVAAICDKTHAFSW